MQIEPAHCTECGEELCGSEPIYEIGSFYMCEDCLIEFLGCTEDELSDLVFRDPDIRIRTAYEAAVA